METSQLIAQFRALADPARLRLLVLCAQGECSVSELTDVLSLSQPRISQHLKTLCDAGLLERFRDGHFVYHRVPVRGNDAATRRRLLELVPKDEPVFRTDAERLRLLRGATSAIDASVDDRPMHRALVELTVATPLGDLLDIGCGQGRVLKLLASRAQRAVGVDLDADARRFARAELLLAGLPNCTLRKGDMYSLQFADAEFDTVILDDVLTTADEPVAAIREAARLLRPGGRLLLLASVDAGDAHQTGTDFADWCRAAGLRISAPKSISLTQASSWVLAVATASEVANAAA